MLFAITKRSNIMEKLTEGVHQTTDDLAVAVYSRHSSFCRTTVYNSIQCQTCSLLAEFGW